MPQQKTTQSGRWIAAAIAATLAIVGTAIPSAQSPSSNKAFFAKSTNQISLGAISGNGYGPVVTLFDVPAALRTSNGGAVSATLSMEAALWTYNLTNAIVNGDRASSGSRAAIKAWIEVDGDEMEPGRSSMPTDCRRQA